MSETTQYTVAEGDIELNAGRRTLTVTVANTGDRAIQVGSHFHFFEVNRALRFDRASAFGMRLDIPAGTAVRFEPGDTKDAQLVELGGARRVQGLNGLVGGSVSGPDARREALQRAADRGFLPATTDDSSTTTGDGGSQR